MRTGALSPATCGAASSRKNPDPLGYRTGSRCECASVWRMLEMAMPRERSGSGLRVTTPSSASELVRTIWPTFAESCGSPSALARSLSKSGTVPSTPPAKMTLRAV